MKDVREKTESTFAKDIKEGLTAGDKFIPSRYFYNEEGDRLFRQIMDLPEYYLTRCETEILERYGEEIAQICCTDESFRLIDLGAGDGSKTAILISHLNRISRSYYFHPIDISGNAIELLLSRFSGKFPELRSEGIVAEYFQGLKKLKTIPESKLVLFLGSNIGNFSFKGASNFLLHLKDALNPGDYVLLGADLKKEPEIIRDAYNDRKGVTAAFNFNLLQRINDELDADFKLDKFRHYPSYDPGTGEVKSYLISQEDQEVEIKDLNLKVRFSRWEQIFTECSNKFTISQIASLAEQTGFSLTGKFTDRNNYFVDCLLKVK